MALHDPSTVDLVVQKRDGNVVLSMFEERPWDGSDERLAELEEKVNAYLTFVLDGHMARDHPDLEPKRVTIQLDYLSRMDERTRSLLPSIEATLAQYGITFAIQHLQEATAG
jgi:hypothetical protein